VGEAQLSANAMSFARGFPSHTRFSLVQITKALEFDTRLRFINLSPATGAPGRWDSQLFYSYK
jgi:hypothetical protein